ncbi:MAG: PQQ-binding-like beta-propeller repeat protein [Christiangramia sp.]|uniref:outer membrane protein assembly factor BamB family protein n=1 Tax=Christiangramia sp. TaxID=1931228 RepID=UPI00324291D1
MKTVKILILGVIFGLSLVACEKDDDPVNTQTPKADFTFTPTDPIEGDEVIFTAEAKEGSSEILSWDWNFGDIQSSTATGMNPSFIYEEGGAYQVMLEVTDVNENVYRVYQPITVSQAEFPAQLVWEFTTNTEVGNINDGSSAPVIGDDGTIFYTESRAGADSKIVAVKDQGDNAELVWASTAIGAELPNAPSIGPDGNIYINAWHDDFAINKLNAADGALMWSGAIGTDVSNNTPAIDSEGNVYHGSRAQGANGGVYSWTSEGEKRWEITGVGAFYAAPVISADESTVYFLNTSEGQVWAINAEDGTQKWDAPVGPGAGIHGTSLSINADGTIYYTTKTQVVAITDEGNAGAVKWQIEVEDASNSGVVIGPEGDLYVGSMGGLLSINPSDGSINWNYDEEIAESVPAVDVNGNVYVGTTDGRLIIVSSAGGLEKEFELGDGIINSPTITANGTLYVEGMDEDMIKLYKITVSESGPAASAWPMKGQNAKNTSQAQ